jgi:perosamine synthetase
MSKSAPLPRIPVAAPQLDGREKEYVLKCLDETWISSAGEFIGRFEQAVASYCGVRHAVATNNGTTAIHLALVALGINAGDEVIVPALTYIASANSVTYCNATPVFVDNDPVTFNIDPAAIEKAITPKTRAIMVVHLFGHPADMDPILDIAKRHNLFVVEDAAEALGAQYKGRMVGGLSDCATFSFFGNKLITTGEGGMVLTNDDDLAARLRLFRGQGMDPERRYWFQVVGYNYRMTNVAAAIGVAQMERIDTLMAARANVAAGYNHRLAKLSDRIALPQTMNWAKHSMWMYTIQLKPGLRRTRDQVMQAMDKAGVETRPVFYPMHVLPPYEHHPRGEVSRAEACGANGINLPTHTLLTEADLDRVSAALEEALA